MTYLAYTQQALSRYTLPRLKRIAAELGISPAGNKTQRQTWIDAITAHQSTQLQKVGEQTVAQAELNRYIAQQAEAVAPEELRTVEISFYDHEVYAGDEIIAWITYDNHLTQPWVVLVEGVEKFRANTYARCYRFIQWHHKDGTLNERVPFGEAELVTENQQLALPPQKPELPHTTENRIMAHIFNECQNYGFEILDDGIYHNDLKLGQVGCTNGNWWVIVGCSGQQQYSNSVYEAVRSLSIVDTSLSTEPTPEYLQYRPLQQLTTEELQQLLDAEATECEQLLDRPVDELTSEDWERLRGYESHLELVAA
ncbi:hypothetical protein WKK05_38810 (plasmid) [Nostoc sp. UHCC 0302]|uniref:hypothetical protein n=1 Tax=Nostoc sp. UHCC 0302 TaxID=3134896 RepID=UPI00311CC961